MFSDELCILTDNLLANYEEIASGLFLTCMSTVHPIDLTLSVLSSESEDETVARPGVSAGDEDENKFYQVL